MSFTYITKTKPAEFKINVLGTEYKIVFRTKEEDVKLVQCDGYCDNTINTIVILWYEWDSMNHTDMLQYVNKVIFHEIIHAFLYQSGLDVNTDNQWARNEEMVDWMALQLHKVYHTCLTASHEMEQYKDQLVTQDDIK